MKFKWLVQKILRMEKKLVNVLNKVNESEVKETLTSTFSGNFCLDEVKKLLSEITITIVPNDMTDEALVTKICDKNDFLSCEINNDAAFSVIKSWTSNRYTGTTNFKNLMTKCSPQIRKHLITDTGGYVYVGHSRCKILITSFYHSAIHATSSNILLMIAQIRISQVPVAIVTDGTKRKIVTVTLWISV